MPIAINGTGTITGLSVGGLEDGIITPAELSTGAPSWDAQYNLTNIASINNGPLAGFRNRIINGNFDIWQRGTSFSSPATGAYTADRWKVFHNGSGTTRTVERVSFPLGGDGVPGEPAYFLRFGQTVAGTGATLNTVTQPIEDVRTFAGQQVTVSVYIRATSAITLPYLQLIQFFGTGGSPSAQVFTSLLTSVSITTSWQRIQATVTVPSILGKTLGSGGDSNLAFDIGLPINTTFSVDIAQVQIEPGSVATPFEQRPLGAELALCQRYYEKASSLAIYGYVGSASDTFRSLLFPFAVEKRAIPTIAVSGGTFAPTMTANTRMASGSQDVSNTNTSYYIENWTASAEL
jgi:hypothetical protein